MSSAPSWITRARDLLESALSELDERDVIPEVTEALTCLHLAAGETPETVVLSAADYAAQADEPEPQCICPPEQLAAGGFKGNCPARGISHP